MNIWNHQIYREYVNGLVHSQRDRQVQSHTRKVPSLWDFRNFSWKCVESYFRKLYCSGSLEIGHKLQLRDLMISKEYIFINKTVKILLWVNYHHKSNEIWWKPSEMHWRQLDVFAIHVIVPRFALCLFSLYFLLLL